MENDILKASQFHRIAANVKPDAKNRIVLSKVVREEGVTYHIYCNKIGQLLLDPQVSIPASEVWLYKNASARRAVEKGLKEAAEEKIAKINLDNL